MKTKRILSVLLSALLIFPMSLIGAGAVPAETLPGTVLYQENYEGFSLDSIGWKETTAETCAYPSNGAVALTVSGTEANPCLKATATSSNWNHLEVLPANTLDGLSQYVVSVKVNLGAGSDTAGFRLGTNDVSTADGDWIVCQYTKYAQLFSYNASNTKIGHIDGYAFSLNQFQQWDIAVDAAQGILTLYVDGSVALTKTSNVHSVAGGLWFVLSSATIYVDDLKVTKGSYDDRATADVIYSENFDTYTGYLKQSANYTTKPATELATVNGSNALKVTPASWASKAFIPATAFGTATAYTIRYDMTVTCNNWMNSFVRFATTADDATGMWLLCDSVSGKDTFTLRSNYNVGSWEAKEIAAATETRTIAVALEVDVTAGTVNVYLNDMTAPAIAATGLTLANGDFWTGFTYGGTTALYFDNVSVTAGTLADVPAQFVGIQFSDVKDGAYNVRFVGVIGEQNDLNDLTAVGFHITAVDEDGVQKEFDNPCTTVYNKIIGSTGLGVTEEYTAEQFGGSYIFAKTVQDIPTSAKTVTFTVTPYFTTEAGEATGTSYTVVVNNGVLVRQNIMQ